VDLKATIKGSTVLVGTVNRTVVAVPSLPFDNTCLLVLSEDLYDG